ncbi:MAG TPA: alpha/beta hydrolase, partial [Thermomicrobiales bacterium]
MTTTVESGSAEINGARIVYEIAGMGHPLTLIHAGIADKRMWDAQFATFAESYRVLRYDVRGYGQSTFPAGPYTMREDLRALLRHLGIARTHLIGVSMGGSIAIDFTLDYPEMVSAVIPVAAGISGEERAPDPAMEARWREIDAATKRGDIDTANELEIRIWVDGVGRTAGPVDPAVREKVGVMNAAALAREGEFERAESVNRLDPPAIGRLGEITAPTLVIVG